MSWLGKKGRFVKTLEKFMRSQTRWTPEPFRPESVAEANVKNHPCPCKEGRCQTQQLESKAGRAASKGCQRRRTEGSLHSYLNREAIEITRIGGRGRKQGRRHDDKSVQQASGRITPVCGKVIPGEWSRGNANRRIRRLRK